MSVRRSQSFVPRITIRKPLLTIGVNEEDFIKKLSGLDVQSELKHLEIAQAFCIQNGKIWMTNHQGDSFLFRVKDQSTWCLVGVSLRNRNKCARFQTSEIPSHWEHFFFIGNDADNWNTFVKVDGFSNNMRKFAVDPCNNLLVTIDWNDIPYGMKQLRIGKIHYSVLTKQFSFLFDQRRPASDFHNRPVIIRCELQSYDQWSAANFDLKVNSHFHKFGRVYRDQMEYFQTEYAKINPFAP